MEESEYNEEEKVSITSHPIFWIGMILVVFNLGLYLWSVNRDTKANSPSDSAIEQVEEASERVTP